MNKGNDRLYLMLLSGVVLGLFYFRYASFFPNDQGNLGHDYSLFMPDLLDGVYWYETNGPVEVPWFTPSFGGGLPKFPNPQSSYYSIPQFLSFFVNPLRSVELTVLIFGILGFAGFYGLLRRVFFTTSHTALWGGTLFLFNGFYLSRMIVGHLTYHSFMLVPFLALLVLNRPHKVRDYLAEVAGGACLLAYMIYSGNIHLIPVVLLCLLIMMLIQAWSGGAPERLKHSGVKCLGILTVAALLSAARLHASISYLSLFPRDFYLLPGYKSLIGTFWIGFQSLFLEAPESFAGKIISTRNNFGLHEYDYGITIVPLIMLMVALVFILKNNRQRFIQLVRGNLFMTVSLVVLLSIPIALNYYHYYWNVILKHLPFIKSSSTLIRWFALYIPVFITLSCLSVRQMKWSPHMEKRIALLGVLGVIVISGLKLDKAHYHQESYDPQVILDNYEALKSHDFKPHIKGIGTELVKEGITIGSNDLLVVGLSQLKPYEPMFGYRLETFPRKTLRPGPVMQTDSLGFLNLKNPASYVFPKANNLIPGMHFHISQKEAAKQLVSYQPYTFLMPPAQHFANSITRGTLYLLLAYYLWMIIGWVLKKVRSKPVS